MNEVEQRSSNKGSTRTVLASRPVSSQYQSILGAIGACIGGQGAKFDPHRTSRGKTAGERVYGLIKSESDVEQGA